MINFDGYIKENKTEYNKDWPYTPDHSYNINNKRFRIWKNKFIIESNR